MADLVKVIASFEVEIDPFWIDYLIKHNDIFMTNRSGYWLRGVEHDKFGWLVYENVDKPRDEVDRKSATVAWREGRALPKNWFRLDRDAAIRAWIEGVKKWGVRWYYDIDAEREDVVVQLALLGEIRYS